MDETVLGIVGAFEIPAKTTRLYEGIVSKQADDSYSPRP